MVTRCIGSLGVNAADNSTRVLLEKIENHAESIWCTRCIALKSRNAACSCGVAYPLIVQSFLKDPSEIFQSHGYKGKACHAMLPKGSLMESKQF